MTHDVLDTNVPVIGTNKNNVSAVASIGSSCGTDWCEAEVASGYETGYAVNGDTAMSIST